MKRQRGPSGSNPSRGRPRKPRKKEDAKEAPQPRPRGRPRNPPDRPRSRSGSSAYIPTGGPRGPAPAKKKVKRTKVCAYGDCEENRADRVVVHIPSDKAKAREWLTRAGRTPSDIAKILAMERGKRPRLCRVHFEEGSFYESPDGKVRLVKGALPLMHRFHTPAPGPSATGRTRSETRGAPGSSVRASLIAMPHDALADKYMELERRFAEAEDRHREELHEARLLRKPGGDAEATSFSYESLSKQPRLFEVLVGMPVTQFDLLVKVIEDHGGPEKGVMGSKVGFKTSLVLFFMFMSTALTYTALGPLFGVDARTASRYVDAWAPYLAELLPLLTPIPTRDDVCDMLADMKDDAHARIGDVDQRTRFIIDCTDVFSERMRSQPGTVAAMYSSYKKNDTVKFLVVIALSGQVVYVSPGYGGSTSDMAITDTSCLLDFCEGGETLLVDRGFRLTPALAGKNITVISPPNNRKGKQFEKHAVEHGRLVSQIRIRVERAIQAIKAWRFLGNGKVRSSAIKKLTGSLFAIAAYMVNFSWSPYVELPEGIHTLAGHLATVRLRRKEVPTAAGQAAPPQ